MIPIIGTVISAVSTLASKWLERKKIEAQGEIDIAKARIEGEIKRAQTITEGEVTYDIEAMRAMRYSWKDEWLCIVYSTMLIACFLPWTQPYMKEGFIFLKKYTPWWLAACFVGMTVATFGLRSWNMWNFFKKRK